MINIYCKTMQKAKHSKRMKHTIFKEAIPRKLKFVAYWAEKGCKMRRADLKNSTSQTYSTQINIYISAILKVFKFIFVRLTN